jgi:hypothetical protein
MLIFYCEPCSYFTVSHARILLTLGNLLWSMVLYYISNVAKCPGVTTPEAVSNPHRGDQGSLIYLF